MLILYQRIICLKILKDIFVFIKTIINIYIILINKINYIKIMKLN